MTAAEMAALHACAFPEGRAWTAREIAALSAPPGFAVTQGTGFALGRAVAGEAELVTIAVDPTARRGGRGRALLSGFETQARVLGAKAAFLEVAEDNLPALALYRAAGWRETGRRKDYYARRAHRVDAITMAKRLG